MENLKDQIELVMDRFDFARVHNVMTLLDWRWGAGKDSGVPSIREIRACALSILKEAVERCEIGGFIATGGFRASTQKSGDTGREFLELEFIAETSDSEYED
jgi:hypothetical protein